jgi:signal transduction histidine kinase
MVYGAAQRHGADIAIDSVPGKGTAVRLTFPMCETSVTEDQAPVRLDARYN